MNCSEGDIPLELGSGLNETALPFCYLNVIDQLSQEIYQSVIPQDMCTVCKRPQNLSSCDVSNLAEDIKNFDIDDIEIPPSVSWLINVHSLDLALLFTEAKVLMFLFFRFHLDAKKLSNTDFTALLVHIQLEHGCYYPTAGAP